MGGAVSRATRFLRTYNIDNRVDRILSKDKPTPAPRYSAEQQHFQPNDIESNVTSEAIHKKNEELLQYLHNIKVYSTGENPVIRRVDDNNSHSTIPPLLNRLEKPLDENSPDGAFGYVEPQRIPPGRISLRQFLAYLQQHRDSPEEYSIDRFVDMYSIKSDIAQKIFKYHSLLALQEVSREQSSAPPRPPHIATIEGISIEAEAAKISGPETGLTSKF